MARRRDGRELFEIFRETKDAQKGAAVQPGAVTERPVRAAGSPAVHTVRLGDRRQVEVFLSLGWVYGIAFFVFLALVGAFVLGRRTTSAPEPVQETEAPAAFTEETRNVVSTATGAGASAGTAAPAVAATPAPARDAAAPEAVTSRGQYTLRVITYRGASAQATAEKFVAWLKEQGFADARVVKSSTGGNVYVTIGSFETYRSADAQDLQRRVRALKYQNMTLEDAYFQNVGSL